jgi:hypothetical protein
LPTNSRTSKTYYGLVAAEVQNETVKHFEGPQPDEEQRTLEDTAGIPTGVSFDIHKQIELRRAKERALARDNLTPEKPHVRQYVQVNVLPGRDNLPPPPPDNLVRDAPDNLGQIVRGTRSTISAQNMIFVAATSAPNTMSPQKRQSQH